MSVGLKKIVIRLGSALPVQECANTLQEVMTSFGLGLRDGLRPRVALTSFVTGVLAATFWLIVFVIWRKDIFAFAIPFVSRMLLGYLWDVLAHFWALDNTMLEVAKHVVLHALHIDLNLIPSSWGKIGMTALAAVFVTLVYVVLMLVTMRVALEILFIGRIQKQCLKRYPKLARGIKSSFKGNFRNMAGAFGIFTLVGLLCLMTPLFGWGLFFLLCSYLNVRGLTGDVLEDIASDAEIRAVIKTSRISMMLLGALFILFLLVPFIGFFAPSVMGAAVCHLCMRKLDGRRLAGDQAATSPLEAGLPQRNPTDTLPPLNPAGSA